MMIDHEEGVEHERGIQEIDGLDDSADYARRRCPLQWTEVASAIDPGGIVRLVQRCTHTAEWPELTSGVKIEMELFHARIDRRKRAE
jgi:ketol-acid reductoisomerase